MLIRSSGDCDGLYGRVSVESSVLVGPELLPSFGNRSVYVFVFCIVFVDVIIVGGGPSLENVVGSPGENVPAAMKNHYRKIEYLAIEW